jgi:FkbM family methyltransferase
MLLDFEEQVRLRNLHVTGIIHVGAHLAEEAPVYDRLGVPVLWIEANEDLRDKIMWAIKDYPNQVLWQKFGPVINDDGDEVMFNITNYDSMSSSVFEFGTHPTFSPDTVFVEHRPLVCQTLDTIVEKFFGGSEVLPYNTLVMDIQGAELLALKGATQYLKYVDHIYCEVNRAEVYVGCAQQPELAAFLPDFDYVAEHMVGDQGWGDGLFVRRSAY